MKKAEESEDKMEKPSPFDLEIDMGSSGTQIYSYGAAFVDDSVGSCVCIVNTGGTHYASSRSLKGEQGKHSYRT